MQLLTLETSNNQRLRSARDNDRKLNLFCSTAVVYLHVTDGQNTRNQLQVIEGPNARDIIGLSAFHSFLVCDYASYIHAAHA